MASVTRIASATVRVPLDAATSFATRQVSHRDYALVRIETDDGHAGIGFCYGGSMAGGLVTKAVRELFAPMLLGHDPHRTEGLWQAMYDEALLHGRTGSVMRAISALDIALWDRNARAAGLPLHAYLGAYHAGSVPAYASGGYYLDGKPPQMLAEEVAAYVDAGFSAVKIKVGRLGLLEEEARIAAAREAIGPDVLLMLDANNAWRDLHTALRFLRVYEQYDPYWIEEPFSPDDVENHRRLAECTDVPVATGEIEAGRWRNLELLNKEAALILQTDAAVCGGISEFRKIAFTAASFGVTVYPHWFHDLHCHLVASLPNAGMVEYFPDDAVLNFRRLIDRQLTCIAGRLTLPDTPGLGFDFLPDAVERYAIDPWVATQSA